MSKRNPLIKIWLKIVTLLGLFPLSMLSFHAAAQASPDLCRNAVDATNRYVLSNKKVAEARFNAGNVSQEQYASIVSEMDGIQANVTMELCMTSGGETFQFFQCMATSEGNYTSCYADNS